MHQDPIALDKLLAIPSLPCNILLRHECAMPAPDETLSLITHPLLGLAVHYSMFQVWLTNAHAKRAGVLPTVAFAGTSNNVHNHTFML